MGSGVRIDYLLGSALVEFIDEVASLLEVGQLVDDVPLGGGVASDNLNITPIRITCCLFEF